MSRQGYKGFTEGIEPFFVMLFGFLLAWWFFWTAYKGYIGNKVLFFPGGRNSKALYLYWGEYPYVCAFTVGFYALLGFFFVYLIIRYTKNGFKRDA